MAKTEKLYEKTKLMMLLLEKSDTGRLELLRDVVAEEANLNSAGYSITVRFIVTAEDLINHKIENRAHLDLTPTEHMEEMIADNLYSGGPLTEGDFKVESVEAI